MADLEAIRARVEAGPKMFEVFGQSGAPYEIPDWRRSYEQAREDLRALLPPAPPPDRPVVKCYLLWITGPDGRALAIDAAGRLTIGGKEAETTEEARDLLVAFAAGIIQGAAVEPLAFMRGHVVRVEHERDELRAEREAIAKALSHTDDDPGLSLTLSALALADEHRQLLADRKAVIEASGWEPRWCARTSGSRRGSAGGIRPPTCSSSPSSTALRPSDSTSLRR